MRTLLLTYPEWDLTLDASGNIALAPTTVDGRDVGDAYAQAQDAASAIRLFQGELLYDTSQGIPYWQKILGKVPSVSLMTTYFEKAALTVPGVVQARAFIASIDNVNRRVTGQVQIMNEDGVGAAATF